VQETFHAAAIWLHILGIALFVGPQFFLAFAWVPASRGIEDMQVRLKAMRTITRRFGYVGGAGLLCILVAGLYLVLSYKSYYALPGSEGFYARRFGLVFTIKMCVLATMLSVLAVHTFIVGPRLMDRLEAQANGENVSEEEIRAVRRRSMTLSITGLALTLVIMALGAMLNTYRFSLQSL
jgi:uncharacterized membrane protein